MESKRYPIRSKENNCLTENENLDKICSSKRRKKYKLDENKALNKKLKCTEIKAINVSTKKGNMIIDLSSGTYELVKSKLEPMIKCILHEFVMTQTTSQDENGSEVEAIYKVASENKMTSFVINMYHTTSRIMVNGKGIEIFKQEVFPKIMELIDVNVDQISQFDTGIRKLLNSSGNENFQVIPNSKRNHQPNSTEIELVEKQCEKITNDLRSLDINEVPKSGENIDFNVSACPHNPPIVYDEDITFLMNALVDKVVDVGADSISKVETSCKTQLFNGKINAENDEEPVLNKNEIKNDQNTENDNKKQVHNGKLLKKGYYQKVVNL